MEVENKETKEQVVDTNYLQTIVDSVRLNPELAKDPEIKNLLELAGKQIPAKKENIEKPEVKKVTIEEIEYVLDDNDNAVDDKGKIIFTKEQVIEKTKPEEEPEETTSSVFFGTKKKAKETKGSSFLDLDKVKEWANKDLGIDTKQKDWDATLQTTVKNWRNDAQELPKVNEKIEGTNNLFRDIGTNHPNLAKAISAYAEGRDPDAEYKTAISAIDITKKFDDYDSKTILLHYYPDDFKADDFRKKEEWDDEDDYNAKQKEIKSTLSIAQKQFETDKKEVLQKRALQQQKMDSLKREFITSVKSSVDTLKEKFPDSKQKELDKIKTVLEKGEDELLSQFLEKNGTLKKDAAIKYAMVLYGEKELDNLKGEIEKRDKTILKLSEDLEQLVGRGKPKPTKTGGSEKPIDTAVQEVIKQFGGLGQKSKYF